ncbi:MULTISPECIES: hypothetical protein [unclassified Capnocytophaga]|uniref:hypothetical protein n=1 Tax=unclassified Capnocytophaga TaxID=2640652 RepID=UPI000202B32B|nr:MULTISPECIES: hypothetical protein [unclassified Capnocytophaga]EGD34090.1 hypothetical protein HMPREF9071_1360 [Capnocytophaga sp. oral taxon 338 str. F0234]MEB3004375.1 hypothetical protein [Capnocytophaga sp. G2]
MASVRRLKKNVASVLGELVDTLIIWELVTDKKSETSQGIVDDIYNTYDKYLEQINHPTENKGVFYKQLLKNFEEEVNAIIAKINALS